MIMITFTIDRRIILSSFFRFLIVISICGKSDALVTNPAAWPPVETVISHAFINY